MKLSELIALVQDTRPNPFSEITLTLWANEVEHKAYTDVYARALFNDVEYRKLNYIENPEQELLIPDQFSDAYLAYLYSKIDFTLGEADRYNNDAAMFDAAFNEFSAWYMRTHYPNPNGYYAKTISMERQDPECYREDPEPIDPVWYRREDDPDPLELDSHFGILSNGG